MPPTIQLYCTSMKTLSFAPSFARPPRRQLTYTNFRRAFLQAVALIIAVSLALPLWAQTDLYVRGAGKLIPIATPVLCLRSGASEALREIPKIIARDLDLSGFFEVIDPGSYIETPGKCPDANGFAYSDWSVVGTEGLVRGTVSEVNGQLNVQMFLHDVPKQSVVLGKEYSGDNSQVARIAHRFANEVMKYFTGQSGPFGSSISFSSRVGRFKELFVMDMDGSNVRQLTDEKGLAVSSAWDPSGSSLVYTSYRNRAPDLFILDLATRRSRQLTRGEGLEVGAKFSRDGSTIMSSRTSERDSDIILLGLDGAMKRNLTRGGGSINVSAAWSPDERKIAFCSNRGGGPQIYTMNSDGSGVNRISFVNSNYCTSPAWSPRGDKVAFVCRADRGFQIFTVNPAGGEALQLTSAGDNEDPDWSPDGRYLVFATTFGRGAVFNLALMRDDGSNIRQLTQSRGGDYEPAWGPIFP